MWASALTRMEVVLAVIGLLASVKSAYNGWVRGLIDNIQMIPEVHKAQQESQRTQEKLVDAVVALSIAESEDGRTVDPREVEQTLRENGSVRDFLRERRNHQGPYADVEDEEGNIDPEIPEEEARWRQDYSD